MSPALPWWLLPLPLPLPLGWVGWGLVDELQEPLLVLADELHKTRHTSTDTPTAGNPLPFLH